jgi:hypothetical protein
MVDPSSSDFVINQVRNMLERFFPPAQAAALASNPAQLGALGASAAGMPLVAVVDEKPAILTAVQNFNLHPVVCVINSFQVRGRSRSTPMSCIPCGICYGQIPRTIVRL